MGVSLAHTSTRTHARSHHIQIQNQAGIALQPFALQAEIENSEKGRNDL